MAVPSYIKLTPNMRIETLVNALNTNFNQIQAQDRRTIIADQDGYNRVILGLLPDGTYGLVISKPGYDVVAVLNGV